MCTDSRPRTFTIPVWDLVEAYRAAEAVQRIVLSMAERASIPDLEDATRRHLGYSERASADRPLDDVVVRDQAGPEGGLFFGGTNVPIETLACYLAAGHSLDRYLLDYPSVARWQAVALLDRFSESIGRLYAAPGGG